jgi:hypothetical protein
MEGFFRAAHEFLEKEGASQWINEYIEFNGTTDSAAYTRIRFRGRAVSISLQDLRMNAGLGHLEWREPHAGRPARTVFRGIWPKDRPAPTRLEGLRN